MTKQEDCLEFQDRHQWRSWLEENHAGKPVAWLVIYKKKYHDQGLALADAVEEALCYGWIDGKLKSLDEKRFALRFTPRAADSVWSVSNIQRVGKMNREGKMRPAGEQKVIEAKENGQWEAAIRRERVDIIPKDLEAELRKDAGALAAYRALPDSRKKQYIYWLQSAKQEQTRRRRVQKILDQILGSLS